MFSAIKRWIKKPFKKRQDEPVVDICIDSSNVEYEYTPTITECIENGTIIDRNGLSFSTESVLLQYKNKEVKCILKKSDIKHSNNRQHIDLKSFSSAYRGLLVYKISEFLGLNFVPFTVVRNINDELVLIQLFIDGVSGDNGRVYLRSLNNDVKYKLFMFDYLIGNLDRNLSNILVFSDKIYLIDNEFTFPSGDITNFLFSVPSVYLPDFNKDWGLLSCNNFIDKLKEMSLVLEDELINGINISEKELLFFKYRLDSIIKAVSINNSFKCLYDKAVFYKESVFKAQRHNNRKKRQLRYGNSLIV